MTALWRSALVLLTMLGIASACTDAGAGPKGAAGASGSAGTVAASQAPVAGFSGGGSSVSGSGGVPATAGRPGGHGGSAPIVGSSGTAGFDVPRGGQSGGGGMSGLDGGSPMGDAGSGSPDAPTRSAGCAKAAGRPAGGMVAIPQRHYFIFPETYDGTQPFPVLMGFHGCGGVNRGTSANDTEWVRLTDASAFEREYVRVVPLSADSGGCWNYGTDIARVKELYDDLLENHCIDTSRVFATGHSSGAQFIVQILTTNHVADAKRLNFKAVAPVAASDYGPMTGPIPVMYIQGMRDSERGNGDGHETVERFRAANGCEGDSTAYSGVAGCRSGATSVNPGCVAYDGCDAPTVWCSHDDPAYSGTMHGVPCFGVTAMYDFFESLM